MGTSNEIKNQKSSLWTTTLADIDKASFPTERDIKRTIKQELLNTSSLEKKPFYFSYTPGLIF